jgi:hypothetical protein
MKRRFTTVDALLDQDEAAPLESSTFDDELWLLLSDRITNPAELEDYPHPVGVYLASRWLEWEVGRADAPQTAHIFRGGLISSRPRP